MNETDAVGARMKQVREDGNHKHQYLIPAIGMSRQHLNNIESGKTSPRLIEVERFADETGASLVWLLTGINTNAAQNDKLLRIQKILSEDSQCK